MPVNSHDNKVNPVNQVTIETKRKNSNKILVVDDEEFCQNAIKVLLERQDVDMSKVEFCITGQEAVTKLREGYLKGHSYRLILTDFNMPIMTGIEATHNIRQFLSQEMRIDREY